MKRPLRLFSSVRISFDSSWLFIVAFFPCFLALEFFPSYVPSARSTAYWLMAFLTTAAFVGSVLARDSLRIVVARFFRIHINEIILLPFGSVAYHGCEHRPRNDFVIAITGPLASLVQALALALCGLTFQASYGTSAASVVCMYLAYLNGGLFLFHLLPAFPLDGGRLLRAILWSVGKDYASATRVSSGIGIAIGVMLMVFGFTAFIHGSLFAGIWWLSIGIILRGSAERSYGIWSSRGRFRPYLKPNSRLPLRSRTRLSRPATAPLATKIKVLRPQRPLPPRQSLPPRQGGAIPRHDPEPALSSL